MTKFQEWNPLKGLNREEIEVECMVRNINIADLTWEQSLYEALKLEKDNPANTPSRTHAIDSAQELKLCQNQVPIITKILEDERTLKTETLADIKARMKHWKDRTYRLKGCFHQDNDVTKLINQWRRLEQLFENSCEKLREHQLAREKQKAVTPVSTMIETLGGLQIDSKTPVLDTPTLLPGSSRLTESTSYTGNNSTVTAFHQNGTHVTWSGNQVRPTTSVVSGAISKFSSIPKPPAKNIDFAQDNNRWHPDKALRSYPNRSISFPSVIHTNRAPLL